MFRRTACLAVTALSLAPALVAPTAAPARSVAAQAASDGGVWFSYAYRHPVRAVAVDPATGHVWAGAAGGALRWDARTDTYAGYAPPDGLAQNAVQAIAVEAGGDIWFGTAGGGLSRLGADGRWSTEHAAPGGPPSDSVTALAVDRDGSLWLGFADAGVGRRAPDGAWTRYVTADGLAGDEVTALAIDAEGDKWIGTAEGASRLSAGGDWSKFTSGDGLAGDAVTSVAVDRAGNAWFGTLDGLSRRTAGGAWDTFLAGEVVQAVAVDREGTAWVGLADGGVARIEGDETTVYTVADGLPANQVYAVVPDPAGRVWAGTDAGLARRDADGAWSTYRPADPPLDANVTAVARDAAGGTWFGTTAGVGHLAPDGAWRVETPQSTGGELPSNLVNALAFDATGDLWAGTANGAGRRDRDGRWTRHVAAPGGLAHNHVNALAGTSEGDMWFATLHGLSRRATDGAWTTFTRDTTAGGLPDDRVYAVAIDRDGSVWCGTFDGVGHLGADGRWTVYTPDSTGGGLPHARVQAIYVDGGGNRWFGTLGGIGRLAPDGRWAAYTVDSTGGGLPHPEARAITAGAAGDLWFGTPAGITRLGRDGAWRTFTTADGLADDRVLAVAPAPDGGLWLGTSGGATRLIPRLPGPDCAGALDVTPDGAATARLDPGGPPHVYAIHLQAPFSRVEALVHDPTDRLEVSLYRGCAGDAGDLTPLATARFDRGEQRLAADGLSRAGRYHLVLRAGPGGDPTPVAYRLRIGLRAALPADRRTLVLTHAPRVQALFGLDADAPELRAWLENLDRLAAHPDVAGLVVPDITAGIDPDVADAYAAWQADAANPAAANAVVGALRNWIWEVRARHPHLRYVVLAGDDRVLPHARLRIAPPVGGGGAGWRSEADYAGAAGLRPATPLGAALASDLALSDDPYAWSPGAGIEGGGGAVPSPELAVGRLVERPREMTAVIEAFLASGGKLGIGDSLVAGSGAGTVAAEQVDGMLETAGLAAASRARLAGDDWEASQLEPHVLGSPRAFNLLAVPTHHDAIVAPDAELIQAEDIALAGAPARQALVVLTGAHAGLSVPGTSDSRALDLAEGWARRGATVIAPAGWSYGARLDDQATWQTELATGLSRALLQDRGMSVGDALAVAKQSYARTHPTIGPDAAFHAKTVVGTLLYGLPMLRVTPPGAGLGLAGSAGVDPGADVEPRPPAGDLARVAGGDDLWLWADRRYDFPAAGMQRRIVPGGEYWTWAGHRPSYEPGGPRQPAAFVGRAGVHSADRVLLPRGVVLRRGSFRDVAVTSIGVVTASDLGPGGGGAPAVDFDPERWYPARTAATWGRVDLANGILVARDSASLRLVLGQYQPRARIERLTESVVLDAYYSAAVDRGMPVVEEVEARAAGGGVTLRVRAGDPGGVARVVAAYTTGPAAGGPAPGSWDSVDLRWNPGTGAWEGALPAGSGALVQVVDNAGNVAVDDNDGRYWPCLMCRERRPVIYLPYASRQQRR